MEIFVDVFVIFQMPVTYNAPVIIILYIDYLSDNKYYIKYNL